MPAGVVRTLTPSASQSVSVDSVGNAEDYSPILINIAPNMTKFLSSFGEAPDGTATDFGWLTEGLEPPKQNAHLEKTDYTTGKVGSIEGMNNYHQYFINSGYVTDVQRKTKKIYNGDDDFSRERTHAFTKQAQDIEYAFVNNDLCRAENGETPALTGGVPFFMKVSNLAATLTVATGVISTGSTEHGLKTGDFVYFLASAMPTGLVAGRMYYVCQDATTPKTKFTIYDTMKDAVEAITANQVKPSSTGTDLVIVKNNVISLGGSADYTLDDINNAMEMAYNRGGDPTDAYMSGRKKQRFSQLVNALSTANRNTKDKNKAVEVATSYEGDFGAVVAHAHRMYGDNRIDIMDSNYWDIKWFDRTHEVTGLAKKGSYKEFVIESRVGLQATQPKASCSIIEIKR